MNSDPTQVLKSIPLRINEIGAETEEQLCAILQDYPFSLQLYEINTCDNNALLMAYVRYRASNSHEMTEEFSFSKYSCKPTPRARPFLTCFQHIYMRNQSQITNILACATDGTPSMVGRYCGFTIH